VLINWHAHAMPQSELNNRTWQGRSPATIEKLLAIHEENGVDLAVVSNPVHYVKGKSPAEAFRLFQENDEHIAAIQQRYPDRTVGFASSIPGGGEEYWKQLERAIKEYGLKGVIINSSHNGEYPDEDKARPFFELVTELDIPVFVHAPSYSFGEECMRMYRLVSSVGRASDECLSLARMIVRGVWEQFPTLKLVGAHLGGGICEVIGRMNYAYELQEEAYFLGPYEPMLINHEPLHYLKMMYVDSVSYHEPALMCAINTLGPDHVVLGADAPPLNPLLPRAIKLVRELPLADDAKEGILWRNAARLMKLPIASGVA
jgi:predicted TIM-barrel fold metal-dependent hydrolase